MRARAADADADDVAAAVREAVCPLRLAQLAENEVERHGADEVVVRNRGAARKSDLLGGCVDARHAAAGAVELPLLRQQLGHALPDAARATPVVCHVLDMSE